MRVRIVVRITWGTRSDLIEFLLIRRPFSDY